MSGSGVITIGEDRLTVTSGDIVIAGLGEPRELKGPDDGEGGGELVLWNLGVAMDHHVNEADDCSGTTRPQ